MPPADLEPGTDTSDAAGAPDLGRTGEWNYFSASEQRLQSEGLASLTGQRVLELKGKGFADTMLARRMSRNT